MPQVCRRRQATHLCIEIVYYATTITTPQHTRTLHLWRGGGLNALELCHHSLLQYKLMPSLLQSITATNPPYPAPTFMA